MSDQITTLKELLEDSVRRFADRTALSFVGGEPISYARFAEHVHDLQTLLGDLGIRPGDKVAIISENMPNWAVTYFAATTMGAIVVPILQEFHPSAVHHILRHSEAKMVVASRRYIDKVDGDNLPKLETVMVMDDFSIEDEAGEQTPYQEALEEARERMAHLSEMAREKMDKFSEAAKERIPESTRDKVEKLGGTYMSRVEKLSDQAMERMEKLSGSARETVVRFGAYARKFIDRNSGQAFTLTEDNVAAILYTSGTTGHSKGVVLTHRNLVQNCLSGVQTIPVYETDRFLSVLPMAHTYESHRGHGRPPAQRQLHLLPPKAAHPQGPFARNAKGEAHGHERGAPDHRKNLQEPDQTQAHRIERDARPDENRPGPAQTVTGGGQKTH